MEAINQQRLDAVRAGLQEIDCDNFLVSSPADIFYLTGLRDCGFMLITPENQYLFISSVNYYENLDKKITGIDIVLQKSALPLQEFKELIKGSLCIDFRNISASDYKKIDPEFENLKPSGDIVADKRVIKDASEIELIRKSCAALSTVFDSIDLLMWEGKTERELAGYLEKKSWDSSCSGPAFPPIIATGKNSAYPHHEPASSYIIDGWLKIDFGLRYKGYCSDLTRTYILDKFIGTLNSEKTLEALLKAKKEAEDLLKPGAICSDIHDAARESLENDGFGEYFIHGLGHGVGLEVHERPYLRPGGREMLAPGMVLTIEPGIYIPGVGGMRMEDTYLITDKGAEQLTRTYQ